MAISGHKDIRMLQRYSHTNDNAKKEAIKKLEKLIDYQSDVAYVKNESTHYSRN